MQIQTTKVTITTEEPQHRSAAGMCVCTHFVDSEVTRMMCTLLYNKLKNSIYQLPRMLTGYR